MIGIDRAREAKSAFLRYYGDHPYINGVGIWRDADGSYVLKVNTTTESAILPRSCRGVPVRRNFVGIISALEGGAA